jgi:hypothetical protein
MQLCKWILPVGKYIGAHIDNMLDDLTRVMLARAIGLNPPLPEICLFAAVCTGNLELVKLVLGRNGDDTFLCMYAAQEGHLHIMQWAMENSYPYPLAFGAAAYWNNLHILQYLDTVCTFTSQDIININRKAVQGDCVEILQWIYERGQLSYNHLYRDAIDHDSVRAIKWLHEHGIALTPQVATYFACEGDIENLIWAYEAGCKFEDDICEYVASTGNLEILKWLHIHGCILTESTFREGINYVAMVEWLLENDCPAGDHKWCTEQCTNLESLKYLYIRGFELNRVQISMHAANECKIDVLEWLHNVGLCSLAAVMKTAVIHDRSRSLHWVLEKGVELTRETLLAALNGNIEVMELCVERGIRITADEFLDYWGATIGMLKYLGFDERPQYTREGGDEIIRRAKEKRIVE